ncbi:MAG: AAA family ATPase [Polyangiaceae bacterium]|nr:AAA family ATPase [Polyangiaceae bacterium]
MKLARLKLENIGALADGEYAFADRATGRPLDVAIVTGPGGCGKTTLCEAILAAKEAAGAYGAGRPFPELRRLVRSGAPRGRIEATWLLDPAEVAEAGLREAVYPCALEIGLETTRIVRDTRAMRLFARHEPGGCKFDYQTQHRRLLDSSRSWPAEVPLPKGPALGALRLGHDPSKDAVLLRALTDAWLARGLSTARELDARGILVRAGADDALAPLRAMLERLLPDLRLAGVEAGGADARVMLERRGGGRVRVDDVSASEEQRLLFALAFWHLDLRRSVVVIDEPELHIPPSEQAELLRTLVSLGDDNQLVVGTASEAILRDASAAQVVRLATGRA